jgi:hypothetical protein
MKHIPAVPALIQAARLVPARLRHGRPWRLAARMTGGFVLAEAAFHSGAGPAAITGTMTGIITWLAFTARADVAPPPGR